jgi:hypothetical protein
LRFRRRKRRRIARIAADMPSKDPMTIPAMAPLDIPPLFFEAVEEFGDAAPVDRRLEEGSVVLRVVGDDVNCHLTKTGLAYATGTKVCGERVRSVHVTCTPYGQNLLP